jgi:hypothetical protein
MRSSQTVDPFVYRTVSKSPSYQVGYGTHKVVHERSTLDENSSVVRKGRLVDVGTVLSNVTTVVD